MIKLLQDTIEKLIVLLDHGSKHGERPNWHDLCNESYRDSGRLPGIDPHREKLRRASLNLMRFSSELEAQKYSYEHLLKDILVSYESFSEEKVKNYSELIDAIVECLSWSFLQNKITGDAVIALRKAVLTPEELQEFTTRIKKEEMSCSCGHKFTFGEAVTYHYDPDTERPLIKCAKCVVPTVVPCSERDCHDPVAYSYPSAHRCKDHRKEALGKKKTVAEVIDALRAEPDNEVARGIRWARELDRVERVPAAAQARQQDRPLPNVIRELFHDGQGAQGDLAEHAMPRWDEPLQEDRDR